MPTAGRGRRSWKNWESARCVNWAQFVSKARSLFLPIPPLSPYISLTWNMLSLLLELEAVDLLQ